LKLEPEGDTELAWKRYPVAVQLTSFYDPKGTRIKSLETFMFILTL
jgi:hypothetical protein